VQDVVDAMMFLESASFVTGEIRHIDAQAVANPDEAIPSAARKPAPPAPTMTTS
jgi:hypothetical protein